MDKVPLPADGSPGVSMKVGGALELPFGTV